jgi:FAD:protein FMN transferase
VIKRIPSFSPVLACFPFAVAATHATGHAQIGGGEAAGSWVFQHEHVLGTSLEIRVRASSFPVARHAEQAALVEIDRQDRILSAWRDDSEFSRWAATRFQPVRVSPELFEVLASFDFWRSETGGALDPSAESAARLWRRTAREGRTPTRREIAETLEAMQQPHWQLDEVRRTATRCSDIPLALASFAKSYISASAAEAARRAGASGVMLNVGGDVVVRGALEQAVAIADPRAASENDAPVANVLVRNRAVATSGSYRRGLDFQRTRPDMAASLSPGRMPQFSHIFDPRTARPTGHVLSSTVIAEDATTAGALATAFSVLSVEESRELAARIPSVEYLLLTREGDTITSPGWSEYAMAPASDARVHPAAFRAPHVPAAGSWNTAYALNIGLELPRIEDARYRRPYVAIWIEDADHFPIRTLALWFAKPRWLPELKQWYRDDQIRNLAEGTDISRTISSATRPPGHYVLKWDGKDNAGKLVNAGKYTVVVEAAREHGGYQIERQQMDFNGQPQQAALAAGKEIGTVSLDYGRH